VENFLQTVQRIQQNLGKNAKEILLKLRESALQAEYISEQY